MKITTRIWILIIAVALSLISIFGVPPIMFEEGVEVTHVRQNSTVFNDGLREGMVITSINGQPIKTLQDYSNALAPISQLTGNQTLRLSIQTNSFLLIIQISF